MMALDQHRATKLYSKQAPQKIPNKFQTKYIRRKSSPLPDVATMKRDSATVRRQSIAHISAPIIYKCRSSLVPKTTTRWQGSQNRITTELCDSKRSRSMVNFDSFKNQTKSKSFVDILGKVVEV